MDSIADLFGFLVFYSLLSFLLFSFTAGGWTMISVSILVGLFFIVINLLSIAMKFAMNKKTVNPSLPLFSVLLFVQALTILANPGDCGDFPGSYNFINVIFSMVTNSSACETGSSYSLIIGGAFYILYAICLFVFILTCFTRSKNGLSTISTQPEPNQTFASPQATSTSQAQS